MASQEGAGPNAAPTEARRPTTETAAQMTPSPAVMGILNVTPDSFSDGGLHANLDQARDHALAMLDAGAGWIDVGGESTRPGATPVGEAEEISRTLPVIEAILAVRPDARISIDTMKPTVAHAAVRAGAVMWNDVTALRFTPNSLETAGELGVEVCLMHMQGAPQTMQANPQYDDIVGEVTRFLSDRSERAEQAGVKADKIWVDPGIGFGKTLEHNLALMRALPQIRAETGRKVAFGASRKSFIHRIDARAEAATDRLGGSLAAALWAARAGAGVIRVHDVAETVQALSVQRALNPV